MGLVIICVICALIILAYIQLYNRIVRYKITITESLKTVDIALAKRYDTLTEMCKVAKSYAAHETETMIELIKVRQANTIQNTNSILENQDKVITSLNAVGEAYPQLQSMELYSNLQKEIAAQNEYLAAAKRTVNNNISIYNQTIEMFPNSIVASMTSHYAVDFLTEAGVESKQDISLNI